MTILEQKVKEYLTPILGRDPTSQEIANNLENPLIVSKIHNKLNVCSSLLTIDTSDSIQDSLDKLSSNNGGILRLSLGTYTLTSDIEMPSGVSLSGASREGCIIDCGDYSIKCVGNTVYDTGTISSITNGVQVVGSGTSWLANVVAGRDHMYFNGQWMIIVEVTDNTHIVLGEGYDGPGFAPGASYRIATLIKNVDISQLTIKNSANSGIELENSRFINIENCILQSNNIGIEGNYITEWYLNNIVSLQNTSHGISLTNGGRNNWNGVNCVVNGGTGVIFNSVRSSGFTTGTANSNTGNGFTITNCIDVSLVSFDASYNVGKGIECVSNNQSLTFSDAGVRANTSDGIKLTATTDTCVMQNGSYEYNGGYGINIAASTCDSNILMGIIASNNTSGSINDSGTGTLKNLAVNILP